MTIWKACPGHFGYEVSDGGRVRSLDRVIPYRDGRHRPTKGRELRAWSVRGYPSVALGYARKTYVHTLVCEAFHGPRPSAEHEVRHLDGDQTNNRAENLAWGTRSENKQDMVRHGTQVNIRKTKCPRGHPYDKISAGQRRCSVCDRANNKAYYEANRESLLEKERLRYRANRLREAS